jgi:hypothetical protein
MISSPLNKCDSKRDVIKLRIKFATCAYNKTVVVTICDVENFSEFCLRNYKIAKLLEITLEFFIFYFKISQIFLSKKKQKFSPKEDNTALESS